MKTSGAKREVKNVDKHSIHHRKVRRGRKGPPIKTPLPKWRDVKAMILN